MKKILARKENRIPFTKEGYQKLLEDRAKFLAARPEAVEHLRRSREMGDLSENGYYKASRQQLSFLDSRIRRVERLIRLAKIVESSNSGIIDIGSNVTISDGTKEYSYELVGGYESNPSKQTISHLSPLGRALIGKKLHDVIDVHAPTGIKKYTIQSVS
jgi:transcription elongation factor GreA